MTAPPPNQTNDVLTVLRAATLGTPYENRLFLVGGYVRDKLLARGTSASDDIDIVLEDDAGALAWLLYERRVAAHKPVIYPNFGTAMVHLRVINGDPSQPGSPVGAQVEMVRARAETYREGSRKPLVRPGTIQTDAERRDFTVNALMENLHTGEILDPTGRGRADLASGILRTPLDPVITFAEDPLRMLRACRFAAKLGFAIAPEAWAALVQNAERCSPDSGISYERMRDEFTKTLLTRDPVRGLEAMRESRLLHQFAPELADMVGVTQNRYHRWDVWTHTVVALEALPPDASLTVRLATLFHDVGKPQTRTVDEDGEVHFYDHENVGAKITQTVLQRLRMPNDQIESVVQLVALHMRYVGYQGNVWNDAAVRRLLRAVGANRDDLFMLARADALAGGVDTVPRADLNELQARMERLEAMARVTEAVSPLTGGEIIALLKVRPGPIVGAIKEALTDAVVAGELAPDDRAGAEGRARQLLAQWTNPLAVGADSPTAA